MNRENLNNIESCKQVLGELARYGLREIVFCAGSRNAPFIACLEHLKNARIYSFFEERSAAFFALGRSRALKAPVAVITTSGTAAAELLPACIEAYHSGVPLVLITADRPSKLRFTGAPQSMNQTQLMSGFVESQFELEKSLLEIETWSIRAPLHINICLDEPLLDAEMTSWSLPTLEYRPKFAIPSREKVREIFSELRLAERPLVILGGLEDRAEMNSALQICQSLGWPVYAEASSGLRETSSALFLRGGEQLTTHLFKKLKVDLVLRLGTVPTTRLWRDLESGACKVLSVSPLHFTGLSQSVFLQSRVQDFAEDFIFEASSAQNAWTRQVCEIDSRLCDFNLRLYKKYPKAETSLMREISGLIRPEENVYLGNSLPIRNWDFAAQHDHPHQVFANRGVNGIDGQLSSFLGLTATSPELSWCIVGDLTTLYDLSAPWIMKSLKPENHVFIVINNGGGQIFHRMYHNPLFENNHDLNFENWARMWSLDYSTWPCTNFRGVIEVRPDSVQTQKFWDEYSEFVKTL